MNRTLAEKPFSLCHQSHFVLKHSRNILGPGLNLFRIETGKMFIDGKGEQFQPSPEVG